MLLALLILGMLALGLGPPALPRNDARIVPGEGLVLEGPGQVVSARPLTLPGGAFTLEVWLRPSVPRRDGANQAFLALLDGPGVERLLLGTWSGGWLLRLRQDNPEGRPARDRYVRWRGDGPRRHLAVAADGTGTRLYEDGEIATTLATAAPPPGDALRGLLVLGDAARGWPRWGGVIEGVAIHEGALDEATLGRHASWEARAIATGLSAEPPRLAWVFAEPAGAEGGGPTRDEDPRPVFPEAVHDPAPPLLGVHLAHAGRWILRDGALNVLFFAPLGFLLAWGRGRRWLFAAALLGLLLTLAIESAQHVIPGRDSSALDVVANSLGAALGAAAALALGRRRTRA